MIGSTCTYSNVLSGGVLIRPSPQWNSESHIDTVQEVLFWIVVDVKYIDERSVLVL